MKYFFNINMFLLHLIFWLTFGKIYHTYMFMYVLSHILAGIILFKLFRSRRRSRRFKRKQFIVQHSSRMRSLFGFRRSGGLPVDDLQRQLRD